MFRSDFFMTSMCFYIRVIMYNVGCRLYKSHMVLVNVCELRDQLEVMKAPKINVTTISKL